jgi:Winged helix DNA-binding domain
MGAILRRVHRIGTEERRARLVTRHRLDPAARADDPLAAARSLVCLHATDAVTVFLAIQARSDGVAPADVERALYEERTLVRLLAMRRTLWAVPRELLPIVFAAATRAVAATQRKRLEGFVRDSGVSTRPGAWITRAGNAAVAAVAARGEAMTTEITRDVPLLAKKLRFGSGRWEVEQNAGARVLPQMAMEGRLVRGRPRGTWISPQFRWVTTEDWLGGPIETVGVAASQAELLRAWLAAFGPGTEADLRWWTGWTARDVRAALAAIPHAEVELGGSTGYVLADDLEPTPPPEPTAALLPTLDPTTMGWKEREWYLGPHGATLFDSNGNAGPTVWWDGRIVGGWSQRKDGEIALGLLEDVGRNARAAIDAEAERLARWVGDVRFSPGFLPTFQRQLAR